MSREATGSVYESKGSWYVAISGLKRGHYRLSTCRTEPAARARGEALANVAKQLKAVGKADLVDVLCRQAASADDPMLVGILKIVDGLVRGTERVAPTAVPDSPRPACQTLREFGEAWTSNELSRRYRGRVREIEHADNVWRLEKHVYPIVFKGRQIGQSRLDEFTLDHADMVLAQRTLPERSVRHVAQVMHRLLKLAVFPARVIERSPFPPGWLPPVSPERARSYLFPAEDLLLMQHTEISLVVRLYLGLANREGPRRGNLVNLGWDALLLDFDDNAGYLTLDRTKNGRDANWALDAGSAEALRRWRDVCPSKQWVFPANAVPSAKRRKRLDTPMYVEHLGTDLRAWLKEAGVKREKLFQRTAERIPLRVHDLRATFVTLALANGKSEAWVMQRTGHKTSIMLARYRRDATSIAELSLGWFTPLHEAIPELAAMSKSSTPSGQLSAQLSDESEARRGS